jgi:chemotaxis response regulator CheB
VRELYAAPPDLVILDVAMPELDGWATLERIRDLSDVPVLMLTAREAELERVRGLQGGANDYVVKPFGHQELVARVQALLRRSGGRAEEQQTYAVGAHAIQVVPGLRVAELDQACEAEDRFGATSGCSWRMCEQFHAGAGRNGSCASKATPVMERATRALCVSTCGRTHTSSRCST